jgi:hypothetical protein
VDTTWQCGSGWEKLDCNCVAVADQVSTQYSLTISVGALPACYIAGTGRTSHLNWDNWDNWERCISYNSIIPQTTVQSRLHCS